VTWGGADRSKPQMLLHGETRRRSVHIRRIMLAGVFVCVRSRQRRVVEPFADLNYDEETLNAIVSDLRAMFGSRLVSHMAYAESNPLKATVLVVDDSVEMRRYLRVLLELDSYQVETASSGPEALQVLRRGCAPQLVLLDLQMPGMDGLETLRRLREFRPQLKVIMCSAEDSPGKIARAASLGAHAYLVKPIQHLYLSAAIERCLNQVPAERPMATRLPGRPFVLPSPSPV
jgi:CheY-like chemotaxis protein